MSTVRECRDLSCPAHGRMLRRIRRLVLALAAERADAHEQSDKADHWHAEVERLEHQVRDERAMGWERAHTTLCSRVQCREHRNPWERTRGTT